MSKRLFTACALSFAALATPALARPYDTDFGQRQQYEGGERFSRSDDDDGYRRRSTGKSRQHQRRASRGERRRRHAERGGRRHRHAHSGGGLSRSCLTAPARALLGRIESKFGAMQIISTCRPGATIAGSGRPSRHASGNAIDFNAGGRKGEVVRWLIATHKSGGTMTYSGMSHIHVDIGSHFVSLNARGG